MRWLLFLLSALAISGGGFLILQNQKLTGSNGLLTLSSDPMEVLSYRIGEKFAGKTKLSSYLDENAASCIAAPAAKAGPQFKQHLASTLIIFGHPFRIGSYRIVCKIQGSTDEVIFNSLAPTTIVLRRTTAPSLSVEIQAGSIQITSQKLAIVVQMSSVLDFKSDGAVALVASVNPGSPPLVNVESGSLSVKVISNGLNPVNFRLGQNAILKSDGKELATHGTSMSLLPSGFVKVDLPANTTPLPPP